MNRHRRIAFSFLLLITPFFATEFSFGYQRPNGADGDPATDGGDGQSGSDTTWHGTRTSEFSYLWIWGRTGQAGGHGGNGIDGPDSDSIALGGNGGDGGNGGSIYVTQEGSSLDLKHTYIARNGGDGGAGGTSTNAPNGRGGNGGNGGSVTASTSAINGISMHANAGNGGAALGFGQKGGDGGSIDLFGMTFGSPTPVRIFQKQYMFGQAGQGGNGRSGAVGGDGGNSRVQLQSVEMTLRFRDFNLQSLGGNAGKSFGNHGGNGGTAELFLPDLSSDMDLSELSRSGSYTARAKGGAGGESRLWYGNFGRGGNGGDATITQPGQFHVPTTEIDSFNIIAAGGDGGMSNIASGGHVNLSAVGGNGGNALIDNFRLDSVAPSRVSSTISLQAVGGNGGASSYGQGGNGGTAAIQNTQITVSHTASISAALTGGSGGRGNSNHDGLGASVSLLQDDLRIRSTGDRLSASFNLLGGTSNNHAGDATLVQEVIAEGNMFLTAKAQGGNSVLGTSGNSHASVVANTTGASNVDLDLQSETVFYNTAAEIGGNAYGFARGVTESGNANINSLVQAGKGRTSSGTADSTAIAVSQTGSANATSFAQSVSTYDRFRPTNPENVLGSSANSNAIAQGNSVNATSEAISMGRGGMAKAMATLVGNSGVASLSTDAGVKELNHGTHVEFLINSDGSAANLNAENFNSYGRSYQSASTDANVHVASYIRGDHSTLNGIESSVLSSQFDFTQGQYELMQTLEYRSVNEELSFSNQLSMTSLMELDSDFLLTGDVYAFFFDTESINGGLDDLDLLLSVNGTAILDQTFSTGDDAKVYLEGWSYNITQSSVNQSSGELVFDLQMSSSSSDNQTFQYQMGIAYLQNRMSSMSRASFSAVPEPSSAAVLGLSLLLSLSLRRRARD